MHKPSLMAVGAQQGRGGSEADVDGLLIGEVRHATGNLLHRMRYWTSLLEAEALGGPAAEAVTELRSSLDGLQQLIASTMELLRPSTVRPIAIPVADIVGAVAIRFGVKSAPASAAPIPLQSDGPFHVVVDPALLDRALIVLAEVYEHDPERAGTGIAIDVSQPGPETSASVSIRMRAKRRGSFSSDPYAPVHHDVNLALATKLLGDTGCACSAVRSEATVELTFVLPLQNETR